MSIENNDDITIENMYRVTPRQLAVKLEKCFRAGNVPFVKGSPGIGKSSIFRQVANSLNLELVDHRLSTSAPEDLSGLPEFYDTPYGRRARFVPFDLFPIIGQPLPAGKEGWLVFLDEINSASKMVQAASYKLLLDKEVGQNPLHERVLLGSAGNLDTDRAITNSMSTALKSRLCTYHLTIHHGEWLEDVALKYNYDARIVAYLSRYPGNLMDFRPDTNEDTFCCPRTWEFMNNFVKNEPAGPIPKSETSTYTGTITAGVAADFVSFTEVFGTLIDIKDVIADPMNCEIARKASQQWANITYLMEHADDKILEPLSKYASRFALDFRILFFKGLIRKNPMWQSHPAFMKATIDLMKHLNPQTYG